MNMGVTLAIYAILRRETWKPFLSPGSAAQRNGLTDITDAHLLARHLEWVAITPAAHNQAFNLVSRDILRWNWMWGRLARWLGISGHGFCPGPMTGRIYVALAREDKPNRPIEAFRLDRFGTHSAAEALTLQG